jgi:hypothetical protein
MSMLQVHFAGRAGASDKGLETEGLWTDQTAAVPACMPAVLFDVLNRHGTNKVSSS